jgi:NAD(P)-dependent dehydrogenase (short-subunit alcohol dehydrogenase family)
VNAAPRPGTAIVTGAARGIGRAVSRTLLQDGWRVLLADVSADVDDAVADLSLHDDQAITVVGDVTLEETRAEILARAGQRLGDIDALVNVAGVGGPDKAAVDMTVDEFRQVLEVNLVAAFALARATAKSMIAAGNGGRIVNMGSLFGQQAVPDGSAYCASKGGVTLLSQALARELGPHAITVNTVAPGYILTDMHAREIELRAARSGRSYEQERAALAESVPLRRHGTPQDVADCVTWLLGEQASYVTGQTLSVNGGIFLT